jgi:transposase
MATGFVPVDRDQGFLLPVDMREWLERDHLVWFLFDVVGRLDLSGLRSAYRLGGSGRRAYDPAMLLTLLVYGLSQGVRSSRGLERACRSDVAFRVICGTWGETPDHATICRFRRRHQDVIGDLFCQVLVVAREMGVARLGLLAVDGTRVAAQASRDANRSESWIRSEVERLLGEAEAADVEDEAVLGDDAGWEVPSDLGDRDQRLEQLERALEKLESRKQARSRVVPSRSKEMKANLSDPDSRMLSTADGGFVQGYNCQIVVTEEGLIAAGKVTDQPNDYGQLSEMLAATEKNLASAGIDDPPDVVVADAGYFDTADIASIEDQEDKPLLLVATSKGRGHPTDPPADPSEPHRKARAQKETEEHQERLRRVEVLRRWADGLIDAKKAAAEIGVGIAQVHEVRKAWRTGGVDAIPVPKLVTAIGPPPRSKMIRYLLETRLADPVNRETYKQRSHLAETPFARIKQHQQLQRFARRGLDAVNAEFLLDCIVHNLLRLRAHQQPT